MGERKTVSADRGGIAAGRDVVGILPAQLPEIIAAATVPLESLTKDQQATIADLQERLGANKEQLRAFFQIIGEAGVAPAHMGEKLIEIAMHYKELRAQPIQVVFGDDPALASLKTAAQNAIDAADLESASTHLAAVMKAQEAALDRFVRDAAATEAQIGRIALTRLRYREAAEHFAAAAARITPEDDEQRLEYLSSEAAALCRQGYEHDDNDALFQGIERWRSLSVLRSREAASDLWALTHHYLGGALWTLGKRESRTELLEEAVAAFRAALEEWTLDRLPMKWGMTQFNLGTTLASLGEREDGTERLEEAIDAFRAALEYWTRGFVPFEWAQIQLKLGSALNALGQRESGSARLEEAVAAYRAALEEYTRERAPLDWAMTQHNLGVVLRNLGERESSTARLEEAARALKDALGVFEAAEVTHYAETVRNNLERVQALLAERQGLAANTST